MFKYPRARDTLSVYSGHYFDLWDCSVCYTTRRAYIFSGLITKFLKNWYFIAKYFQIWKSFHKMCSQLITKKILGANISCCPWLSSESWIKPSVTFSWLHWNVIRLTDSIQIAQTLLVKRKHEYLIKCDSKEWPTHCSFFLSLNVATRNSP